jgi:uridine kinase
MLNKYLSIFLFSILYFNIGSCSERDIVAIAGGSGSGKTTIMQKIANEFPSKVVTISQDSYYKDLAHLTLKERAEVNFDHPNSLDFDLLKEHLLTLKEGNSIEIPIYDFASHTRVGTKTIESNQIIIIEGVLILAVPEVRELFDFKLFVDTDADLCFIRRATRDINERGRDLEGVKKQYLATVHPMFLSFVEPSKRFADLIIPWNEYNDVSLNFIIHSIKSKISS